MMRYISYIMGRCIIVWAILLFTGTYAKAQDKKPVIVITDCYHPYQDPGDNLDLINGYTLPEVDLKGIILDITDAFRKDTADHPVLWKDPRGPREAGFIPVLQLNYLFDRNIPYAMGPLEMMRSEDDKMTSISTLEEGGLRLLFDILESSPVPVDVLSFGSARVLAVALNRNPALMKEKINKIHLSAGTASPNYEMGSDQGANSISGGEWNVALDVYAFTRILRSDLPVAIYPCAGKDGGFVKDVNNTYWTLKDMSFLKKMDCRLQNYLDYAFGMKLEYDFLRQMDKGCSYSDGKAIPFSSFHVWETAIWQQVTDKEIVKDKNGNYRFESRNKTTAGDQIVESRLRPCRLEVRDDGRFRFWYDDSKSNLSIYYRSDTDENEKALNEIVPHMFMKIKTSNSNNKNH